MERSEIRERSLNRRGRPRITLTLHPGYESESFAYPEPHHEALTDLHGVAVGAADARLIVDAGRNKGRAAFGERGVDELVEVFLVARPRALAQSRCAGERHIVGRPGRRGRLAAGDLVEAVVHNHHGEVFRLLR